MSKLPKRVKDKRHIGEHQKYISRITKTLYYGKFPKTDELSLPVTELAAELFSEAQKGRSLDRLHCDDAANISRNACVSPCSLVIAILYLERLKKTCPEYLERTASSDLFLVSLMVSCKFLYDDGEADEVFMNEWAPSGGMSVKQLVQLEKEFLKAIDWEVFVTELTFWKKLSEIETTLARNQGGKRGFYTYTELERLLTSVELRNLIQNILTISVILITAYTAALLTLLGSVLIVSHIPGACLRPQIEAPPSEPLYNETNRVSPLHVGIFLASIESFLTPFCNKSETQNVSWDWWSAPTMTWLYETSKFVEVEAPTLGFLDLRRFYKDYFLKLDLEDQVHKETKVRIQDQLERSWHEEWTDTIGDGFYNRYLHYLQNLKA
nr:PREDICTED: LOW QUALITY PROTEIN: protein CNPPD1 [Tribolium castaneum]|eukprot:XP_008198416.2 PREDICTED: LOW QUALITY PROTEIN: protein CNPPD1 [Tribolium castaneum]